MLDTPSFLKIFLRWDITVWKLMNLREAISFVVSPSEINLTISISEIVN